mgnify:CR=1 FL=1
MRSSKDCAKSILSRQSNADFCRPKREGVQFRLADAGLSESREPVTAVCSVANCGVTIRRLSGVGTGPRLRPSIATAGQRSTTSPGYSTTTSVIQHQEESAHGHTRHSPKAASLNASVQNVGLISIHGLSSVCMLTDRLSIELTTTRHGVGTDRRRSRHMWGSARLRTLRTHRTIRNGVGRW